MLLIASVLAMLCLTPIVLKDMRFLRERRQNARQA
jgi:hypothetical protein